MRQTLRTWATISIMIIAWSLQFTLVTDYKSSKYLKEEIEIALHDAGLFLDQYEIAEGLITFNRNSSYDAFVQSLEMNTGLRNLAPNSQTFFQDEFIVTTYEIFDDSNAIFPYEYNHPTLNIREIFFGPTIYVIVESYAPNFLGGSKNIIKRAAAYTYKP
jgi:hypothetical protein